MSPVLANIYLHYVLDLWFKKEFSASAIGQVDLVRYCDDYVAFFSHQKTAEKFQSEMIARLKKFNLEIAPEKTNLIEFGRNAWQKWKLGQSRPKTFTFLGFTHFCSNSRRGNFMVSRKTAKESFRRKLKEIQEWIKKARCVLSIKDLWQALNIKLLGYYRYFGVSGNMYWLKCFYNKVMQLIFKWINRRSQKRSMTREQFNNYLNCHPIATPKIYVNLFTLSPIGKCSIVEPCVGKSQARF